MHMSSSDQLEIPPNLTCIEEYVVKEEHVAKHVGSGDIGVLSTPSMIAFMERTSMKCVQQYLPQNYTTVGTLVNVRHLNPAPLGGIIKVESKLIAQDGRRLLFQVKAFYKNVLIGEGQHERFIVHREKFAEKLRRIL